MRQIMSGAAIAMYTIQALWTIAREKLDIIVLVYVNHKYAILKQEMDRMGANNNDRKWPSMLDIDNPELNWVKLSESMGVEAVSVKTTNKLADVLQMAATRKGPILIEALI